MPTVTPGLNCTTLVAAPLGEYSVDPAGLSVGAYAADSLSTHFFNGAGSVVARTWEGTGTANFLSATTDAAFVLAAKYCSRDQEVETWTKKGMVFLRLTAAGKAIFFDFDLTTANGTLTIGIVTGLDQTTYMPTTKYTLYTNSNIVALMPGYSNTPSLVDAQRFIFGADGFDIYAKFNGTDFVRIKDFRHAVFGKVAIKALGSATHMFRATTVRNFSDKTLFSDTTLNTFDVRDFGFRSIQTTGSITASSSTLTLAGASSFVVGDYVIVEIGKEPGAGVRGTKGVGGTWPAKSYANLAAMQADTSQANNLHAWLEDTGAVYIYATGTSTWALSTEGVYYVVKGIPRALQARVTAVADAGATLTLDKTAAVSVTSANVYLDVAPIVNFVLCTNNLKFGGTLGDYLAITPSAMKVSIPAGSYAVGGIINFDTVPNSELYGAGADVTMLFSPKGASSATMRMPGVSRTIRDLHLVGNARNQGFGLNWATGVLPYGYNAVGLMDPTYTGNGIVVTEGSFTPGSAYPYGIYVTGSNNVVRDAKMTNVFQGAVNASASTNCWAYDCHCYMLDGLRCYIQWMFQWADSTGGGCVDCSVTSSELMAGFEAFRSTGVQFIRPVSINSSFSSNSAGNLLIEDLDMTVTPLSQNVDHSFSALNPLVNINANIQNPNPYSGQGVSIVNPHIIVQGYINADNDGLQHINATGDNPNVTVTGGYISGPNWAAPSIYGSPVGVHSDEINTVVDGLRVVGTTSPDVWPYGNIALTDGVIRNCIADLLYGPVNVLLENNQTNAQYEASLLPPPVISTLSTSVRGMFGLGRMMQSHVSASVAVEGDEDMAWARPADWPVMPVSFANKIDILVAVTDDDSNFAALSATTVGGYTVDWGDGVVENVASGVQANHKYTYATLATPVTSRGYKTAFVSVYPQAAAAVTAFNLGLKNSAAGLGAYSNQWLDVQVNCPSCTSMAYRGGVEARWVERIKIVAIGSVTTLASAFIHCNALQFVSFPVGSLASVALLTSAFQNCYSLSGITFPAGSLTAVTAADNAFNGCTSLPSITFPDGSLVNCTNLSGTFLSCVSLQSISFPVGSLAGVTTLASFATFCYSLKAVAFPAGSLGSCTNLSAAFSNCYSVKSVSFPTGSLSLVTTLANAFEKCYSLPSLSFPAGSLAAVTTINTGFNNCLALQYLAFPTGAFGSLTDAASAFTACTNIEKILNCSIPISFTLPCNLSGTELNAVYTALPTVSAKTLTIAANYGVATDTPTIATAKGWTLA